MKESSNGSLHYGIIKLYFKKTSGSSWDQEFIMNSWWSLSTVIWSTTKGTLLLTMRRQTVIIIRVTTAHSCQVLTILCPAISKYYCTPVAVSTILHNIDNCSINNAWWYLFNTHACTLACCLIQYRAYVKTLIMCTTLAALRFVQVIFDLL